MLGPYENKDKWRLVVKSGDKRKSLVFDTVEQAATAKSNLLASFDDSAKLTIGDLLAQFIEYKRQRGCVDRSLLHVKHTIMRIFPKLDKPAHMSPEKAEALYLLTVDKYAVASHAIALRTVKAMFRFAVKKKLVAKNPFDDVQSIGRANKGKLQLRTDEAKRLTDFLTERASLGEWRALALLTQLFLGLRSSEVLALKKRDLDCEASVIVVDGTKTKNAKRRLALDAPIVRELLRRRAEGMKPDALLFSLNCSTVLSATCLHKALTKYCQQADLPIVCPHSLRGLHSSLAVQAGASSSYVARALGHGSDEVTKRHYISESAMDSARSARVSEALAGDLDGLIATLLALSPAQRDQVCSTIGYRR
ncbi:MAG: tyrosine-type recombinase/integrase [Myxococcales bacterium]|nr:tyrosine-type recombinase/integrase [Myxococcales bacterium]